VGSSALPAGGHLVHGESPGRLVKRAAAGSRRSRERRSPCVLRALPASGKDSGWTSVEPTCGACSRARAACSRRASMRPPPRLPDSTGLTRAVHSSTLASLSGGVCQLPLGAPWARGKPFAPRLFPECLQLASIIRVPHGCKTPERGLKTRGSLVPLVVIACGTLAVRGAAHATAPAAERTSTSVIPGRERMTEVDAVCGSVHAASLPQRPRWRVARLSERSTSR
jgi:hypothetical protein